MDKEYLINKKSLQVDPLNNDLNFIDHLLLVCHSDKIYSRLLKNSTVSSINSL